MPRQRVIFHIGLEKTGTTSFQEFCTDQKLLLKHHGVLYPTASWAFRKYNHAPLVSCYLDYRDFSMASSGRRRGDVLRSLNEEISRSGLGTVLISSEHLSSRFREAEIAKLRADFSAFDCRIAVVVRDHRARLFSAYTQTILSGRHLNFDEYCTEVFHPDNRYLRYAPTIAAWEQSFGHENINVLCYSPTHDIVQRLGTALVAPDLPVTEAFSYRTNIAMNQRAAERLRHFNAAIAHLPGFSHPAARRFLQVPRRGMAQLLSWIFSAERTHHWVLSEPNLRRLNDIADADSLWLNERYNIDLYEEAHLTCHKANKNSSTRAK